MRQLSGLLLSVTACAGGASSPASAEVEVEVAPAPPRPAEARPPIAATSEPPGACSLSWTPRTIGASVVTIPPETSSSMMAPVLAALCACTKRGRQHSIVIDFEPGRGRATARDGDGDADLDRCLEPRLGDELYPPFEIGSDCIDCGPKRYGVFGGPPPPPPRGARIRMPLAVDRRGER
jgi:hypothetical protein